MKKLKTLLFIILICLTMPLIAFAHSGRTDSNGGHHDYKNKSGLGSYHYHCGGNPPHLHPGGVCPYSNNSYDGYDYDSSYYDLGTPSISVTNKPSQLYIGDDITLNYDLNNTLRATLEITSSNENVVQVVDDDTLKALSAGESTITITTNNASTEFTIVVKPVEVESITISNMIDKLQLGNNIQFEAVVNPSNATDKTITWSSSNHDIVTVYEDTGYVYAVSPGNAIITCTASNGVKVDIPISVYEVFPTSIETANITDDVLRIECTHSFDIDVNILPNEANNKSYTIEIANHDIAYNSDNTIYATQDGDTNIRITTHNGITKDIPLHIYHTPTNGVRIKDDNVDYLVYSRNLKVISKDQNLKLYCRVFPERATYKNINWKSSNENIILCNDDQLSVVGTGNVKLTAYTYDGDSDTINLYVIDFYTIIVLVIICIVSLVAYSVIWYQYKLKNRISAL